MHQFIEEEDLLGCMTVSNEYYYGIHTLRALENFKISHQKISGVPAFIRGLLHTKKAAALANFSQAFRPVTFAELTPAATTTVS